MVSVLRDRAQANEPWPSVDGRFPGHRSTKNLYFDQNEARQVEGHLTHYVPESRGVNCADCNSTLVGRVVILIRKVGSTLSL